MIPNSPISPDSSANSNRWVLAVLVTACTLLLVYLLRFVLLPFVVAGGLAFVAAPAVRHVQNRFRLPRWAAALVPFLLVLAALIVIALAVQVYVVPQAVSVLGNLKPLTERFLETVMGSRTINIDGKSYGPHQAAEFLLDGASSAIAPSQALPGVAMAGAVIMGFILTIVLLLYFLVEAPRIARGAIWLVPPTLRPRAAAVAQRAGPMIFRYVGGVIVVTIYATTLTFIVARYFLHVENALVLAIAVGLLELIPVIGPILSIVLIAFIAIEQITFWGIVGVSLFATGLRLSIDQLVGPIVLGKSVNLPPPVVIFAFMAGGAIWGILGVIVAIPVTAVIKIILEESGF